VLYQLSTGKTINISLEQFLDLTDEDEQYLVSLNYGDTILSPFFKSSLSNTTERPEREDDSIDYIEDLEELSEVQQRTLSLDEEPVEIPNPEDLELE